MASMQMVLIGMLICLLLASRHAEGCGWSTTALNGTVQSPNFPSNYSNNLDCVYIITAPAGYQVTLTFTHFDLEPHKTCLYDYLQIRDGDETSPVIGKYCNTSLPGPRRTFGNRMWIRFKSDVRTTRSGFKATFVSAQQAPFFLFATFLASSTVKGAIHRMDVDTGTSYIVPMTETLYRPVALDYDPVEQTIYWTEVGQFKGIRASSLDGSGLHTVFTNTDSQLDGLAVDALSRLLFYTDSGRDLIAMITMSSFAHKTIINTNLDHPHAIVLNTAEGVMFWSAVGANPRIERANYDGTDRRTLVSSGLQLVYGLALDAYNTRLYWVDAGPNRIETCDTEGRRRARMLEADGTVSHHLFDLAYLKGFLYITDWDTGPTTNISYILRVDIAELKARDYVTFKGQRMNGIHVVDPQLSPAHSVNGCGNSNGGCDAICVPLPGNSSKCVCPDEQTLASDLSSCGDGMNTANPTVRSTTTSTSRSTTPLPTSFTVVVSTPDPQPLDTNGEQEMTLNCAHDPTVRVKSYVWNVPCTAQAGRMCVFKPRPAEDDGQEVTCMATSSDGYVAFGALRIQLNYPPQDPPTIHGYSKDAVYKEGDSLRMTCSVHGGKPLVTAVFFSCGTHYDSSPDIIGTTEVHSELFFHPLAARDDGQMCTCTARWKETDWYQLSATLFLTVNATTEGSEDNITAIAVGTVIAVIVVIAIIIVVVCIVRKGLRCPFWTPDYDRPQRKGQREAEAEPYRGLGTSSTAASVPQPAGAQARPYIVNASFQADPDSESDEESKYDTLEDVVTEAVQAAPADGYLEPTSSVTPTPAAPTWHQPQSANDGYMHATANPNHVDYGPSRPQKP